VQALRYNPSLMPDAIRSDIPARLDRLPWSRFHWLVVFALGVTWILDGLEVTFKGAVSGVLQLPGTLGFSAEQIGLLGSGYLGGAVLGALFFGRLTDRYGRKRLFFITLAVYLAGVGASAFAWDFWSFFAFRFVTGCGIGGEYAAINSAIDELIPARHRGRVGLMINGSFWLGAALGSGATVLLLDPALFAVDLGWRLGFGIGAALGLLILACRRFIPESPRWLLTHGRAEEAERIVAGIERGIGGTLPTPQGAPIELHPRRSFGLEHVAHVTKGLRTLFGEVVALDRHGDGVPSDLSGRDHHASLRRHAVRVPRWARPPGDGDRDGACGVAAGVVVGHASGLAGGDTPCAPARSRST